MNPKFPILISLIILSGVFYYHITGNTTSLETSSVTRVIDGDTLILADGRTLRLKGINTPEKSMPYYEEAKEFLSKSVENKSVQIESSGVDRYGRTLAYVFSESKNLNRELLARGLATLFYYKKDGNYGMFRQAEEFARLNQAGLWKKSPDANCLGLINLKTDEPEELVLRNNCEKELEVFIKDDATHIYKENIPPDSIFKKNFSHIWNNKGDSVYISDTTGLLMFYRYTEGGL